MSLDHFSYIDYMAGKKAASCYSMAVALRIASDRLRAGRSGPSLLALPLPLLLCYAAAAAVPMTHSPVYIYYYSCLFFYLVLEIRR